VVQTVERILYAANDEESKRVIADTQAHLLAGRDVDGTPLAPGSPGGASGGPGSPPADSSSHIGAP